MFYKEWDVLLVDDEPDVLNVSKLAMRNFEVYGLPLNIHTAESKAQALEILNSRPPFLGLAVAFIDVVMETDTAGLELCQHIREERGDKLTQLFIRTGQPGIAPEREVIDRYDINGYFTKAEATEDKLYSLVKGGVRQHLWSTVSLGSMMLTNNIIAASGSREKIGERYQRMIEAFVAGREGVIEYASVGDNVLTLTGWDEGTARAIIADLDQRAGTPLSRDGDKYVTDDNNHLLIKIAPQPSKAETYWLARTGFTPPHDIFVLLHSIYVNLATVWQQAS